MIAGCLGEIFAFIIFCLCLVVLYKIGIVSAIIPVLGSIVELVKVIMEQLIGFING